MIGDCIKSILSTASSQMKMKQRLRLLYLLVFLSPLTVRTLLYTYKLRGWVVRIAGIGLITLTSFRAMHYRTTRILAAVGMSFFIYKRWSQRKQIMEDRKRKDETVQSMNDMEKNFLKKVKQIPKHKHTLTTRDGVHISFETIGSGKSLVFILQGLEGRYPHFAPVVEQMAHKKLLDQQFTVVNHDYRGFFESTLPEGSEHLSIRDHAEDVMEIALYLGYNIIHTVIGWSTGCQVALELCTIYPQNIGRLVLLNSTHGCALQSVFQPIIRVPGMGELICDLISLVRTQTPMVWAQIASFCLSNINIVRMMMLPYSLAYNNPDLEWLNSQYFIDVCTAGKKQTDTYLRTLQVLNSHSSEAFLPEIEQRTLIVTGMLDVLTPAYRSFELHQQLPNSQLVCYMTGGHFLISEHPEVGVIISEFITQDFPGLCSTTVPSNSHRQSIFRADIESLTCLSAVQMHFKQFYRQPKIELPIQVDVQILPPPIKIPLLIDVQLQFPINIEVIEETNINVDIIVTPPTDIDRLNTLHTVLYAEEDQLDKSFEVNTKTNFSKDTFRKAKELLLRDGVAIESSDDDDDDLDNSNSVSPMTAEHLHEHMNDSDMSTLSFASNLNDLSFAFNPLIDCHSTQELLSIHELKATDPSIDECRVPLNESSDSAMSFVANPLVMTPS